MVELLVVIVILAVLIALLLPAINAALRTAKNAAVGAEINQLAQALASFKTRYGDYPPSRILLAENGSYATWLNGGPSTVPIAPGDITYGQLAQRSVAALRKFFPRVVLSTTGVPPQIGPAYFYDFNGNGLMDGAYILQGHEALVFWLGGIPHWNPNGPPTAVIGFGKDPTNPFSNDIASDPRLNGNQNPMYSNNRQPPLFEFAPSRLALDPLNPYGLSGNFVFPQIPGYFDTLGNVYTPPSLQSGTNGTVNFYAYFSSYGGSGYDPNDVNLLEFDPEGSTTPYGLQFHVNFPVSGNAGCLSPGPNPYTSTTSAPGTSAATFLNPQTFQIISSGIDGLYGVGGQYSTDNTAEFLQVDATALVNTNDTTIRNRERDNVSNFHNGKLE
jgi:general secretion pathway protein G